MGRDEASEPIEDVVEVREGAPAAGASQRARLAIVAGGTLLLAAIVGIVVLTGGSEEAPGAPTGTCFETWNQDAIAPIQDGQHAYNAHGYRQTLVTRLDRDGQITDDPGDEVPADDPNARCVVIFAAPQPDFEPDFGVRVYDKGVWTGLALADKAELDEIADLQAEAVPDTNAVLAASGQLEGD